MHNILHTGSSGGSAAAGEFDTGGVVGGYVLVGGDRLLEGPCKTVRRQEAGGL
jgi:hypothetical protein